MRFVVHAIPDAELVTARSGTGEDAVPVTAEGGESLRCCLRSAWEGEVLLLAGYRPPIPRGPYVETGAVFVHATPCGGPAEPGYPREWYGRPQVLRAYDERGWIRGTSLQHDGGDPAAAVARAFGDPEVVQVHSRNVVYGCFMFRLTRA
jgi:hypothetical protein